MKIIMQLYCILLLVLDSPPKLKDLHNLITPEYAAYWRIIGTSLGFGTGYLGAIESGYPKDNFWCCNTLLEKWVDMDTTASWKKIIKVIDSPAVTALIANTDSRQGNYAFIVMMLQ